MKNLRLFFAVPAIFLAFGLTACATAGSAEYSRGYSAQIARNYARAITEYTKAIEKNPDYVTAYYDRGRCYLNIGEMELARNDFNEVLRQNPDHPFAKRFLKHADAPADIYLKFVEVRDNSTKNDNSSTIAEYTKLINRLPDFAPFYFELGSFYYYRVRLDNQWEYFEPGIVDLLKALELDPDDNQAANRIAELYFIKADYDNAEKYNNVLLELDPPYSSGNSRKAKIEEERAIIAASDGYATVSISGTGVFFTDSLNPQRFIPTGDFRLPLRVGINGYRLQVSGSFSLPYQFIPGHSYKLTVRTREYGDGFRILLNLEDETYQTRRSYYHWVYFAGSFIVLRSHGTGIGEL